MKKSLKKNLRQVVKSFRDIAILAILEENEDLNGYEVMKRLFEKLGILLSSGTIYSTLYALEREQLIKGVSLSKCRTYKLTSKGHAELEQVDEIIEAFKLFMIQLCGKKAKQSLSIQR